MPQPTDRWRWIIESTSMVNNDETVWHQREDITRQEFHERYGERLKRPFEEPHLVISRPVFKEEIDAGLDIKYRGSYMEEGRRPKLTRTLDGVYKLLKGIEYRMLVFKAESRTPGSILSDIIGQHFYDCLSGGMPVGMMVACRQIIRSYNIDLSIQVYPASESKRGKNAWYTLADFMNETAKFEEENLLDGFAELLKLPEPPTPEKKST